MPRLLQGITHPLDGGGEDRAPAAEGPQIPGDHACGGGGERIVHPPRRDLRYTGTMHAGAEGARHSSSGAITHPREGRAFAGIY